VKKTNLISPLLSTYSQMAMAARLEIQETSAGARKCSKQQRI